MGVASKLEGGAQLKAEFEKSMVKCDTRDKARHLVQTIQRVETKLERAHSTSMYLGEDEKGQRAHARVLVFLNPSEAVDWLEPFHTPPAIKGPRAPVTYPKEIRRPVMSHLNVKSGVPVLDEDGDPKVKVQVVDVPQFGKEEAVRAMVRELVRARGEHGPDDVWAVYGRNCAGERCEMLLAGPLSRLRYYFPDSMTRQALKRAGVDVKALGNPYQIRRFGI